MHSYREFACKSIDRICSVDLNSILIHTLYEKLFDDDILNLEVETEVLKTVFERDGLLSEFDITSQKSDDKK